MGNTALKEKFGFEGTRMDAKSYWQLVGELTNTYGPLLHVVDIPAYPLKADHGDIDLVTYHAKHDDFPFFENAIKKLWGARYVKKNSCVYSFDFKELYQVDLAVLPNYASFLNYLHFASYSPCGNVLGRLCRQVGLKWGIDGLVYPVKLSDSEQLGEIPVTGPNPADPILWKLLRFMGLDDREYNCFTTQESIFQFLASSKFFNRDIFQYENLNHVNRKRDSKRPDYHAWLDYIKDIPSRFVQEEDKTVYIPEIQDFFKVDIYEEWQKLLGAHLAKKDCSQKFNGEMVKEITGLEGEALGKAIKGFKDSVPDFNNYVLVHPKIQVTMAFQQWYSATLNDNKRL